MTEHEYAHITKALSDITDKLYEIAALNEKIAKTLHLLPVTKEEELKIQAAQRDYAKMSSEVAQQLDSMIPPPKDLVPNVFTNIYDNESSTSEVFDNVIADDFLK